MSRHPDPGGSVVEDKCAGMFGDKSATPKPAGSRIAHVIAAIDNEAAGTTTWLRHLVPELVDRQLDVTIIATSADVQAPCARAGLATFRPQAQMVPGWRTLLYSRAMRRAVVAAARSGAVLHSSGLWRMPNIYAGWAAAESGSPLVVSPHGMLGPGALEFSKRRKKLFSFFVQRRALEHATCWHATSLKELDDIRAFGITAPVAIIPNGVDVPDLPDTSVPPERRSVLYLGRIHPKKGLDRFLSAWALIEPQQPGWDLRVVGPSESGHRERLQAKARNLGLKQVQFHSGLYRDEKIQAYREADVFVLPTRDENFGMVVAESLANSTPVICTKSAPWEGLRTHDCGWWIDQGLEPLVAALSQAMAMPRETLKSMGRRGRVWMAREFSWRRVGADMDALYRWCAVKGDPPPFLHFNRCR